MKLINKTQYPTRALRSILIAVHNAEPRGRLKTWDHLEVHVIYSKRGRGPYSGHDRYTGHAYLDGRKAVLSVPRQHNLHEDDEYTSTIRGLDVAEFAALWRHEMWHLYGLRHGDYPRNLKWCKPDCVDHVDLSRFGQYLHHEVGEPKPKPSAEDKKRTKVEALLKRRKAWLTKHKRATNALAKIDRSLRYYEQTGIEEAAVEQPKAAARPKRRSSR